MACGFFSDKERGVLVKKQKRNKYSRTKGRRTNGKSPPGNNVTVNATGKAGEARTSAGAALVKTVSVPADEYRTLEHSRKFEKELVALEKRLHNAEDPMEIT